MGTPTVKPILGYYTPQEIRDRFNWSHQYLHTAARREKWRTIKAYDSDLTGLLYLAQDVDDFALARIRTALLRQLGAHEKKQGNNLIRQKEYDMTCPVCGAYAVWKPVNRREEVDRDHIACQPWLCLNGHTGKTSFFHSFPPDPAPEILPGIVAFYRSYVFRK